MVAKMSPEERAAYWAKAMEDGAEEAMAEGEIPPRATAADDLPDSDGGRVPETTRGFPEAAEGA